MQLTRHLDANAPLVALIESLATRDGFAPTLLPGVQVLRASCDLARGPQIYEPSLMIMVQGSKLAYLGPRTLEYGAGHYLIQALPVPFECETFAKSANETLLGISVGIDRVLLGELVLSMGLNHDRPAAAQTLESMTSVVFDDTLRGCVERLLLCLQDPLECRVMGQARVRELLFAALRGNVGDELKVSVEPEDAYGEYSAELVSTLSRSMFEGVDELEVGMQFHASAPDGQMQIVTIRDLDGDDVTVDGNHPLAGQRLTFQVKIIEIRDASQEEVAHGHVHGEGGHHH